MPVFLAAAASSGASPAPVLDWVDTISVDYPIGPLVQVQNPGFKVNLATLFTTTQGGLCTGVRMRLGTQSGPDPTGILFRIYAGPQTGFYPPLSEETVAFDLSMYGQIVQTTVAFTPINLSPNTAYLAAAFVAGIDGVTSMYNYAADVSQAIPPYLPKSFAKYTVEVGSYSAVGPNVNYPANLNASFANYIEPLIA